MSEIGFWLALAEIHFHEGQSLAGKARKASEARMWSCLLWWVTAEEK